MTVELINFVVLWIKSFPPSSGVSDTFCPITIMLGTTLDYEKQCKLPFGAYVETRDQNTPKNTLAERTIGAIWLGPTSKFQGSYKFLCLNTGKQITRKQIHEVPMTDSFINRVEAIATHDTQSGEMVFDKIP
jgi:hypothetical protein